MRVGGQRHAPVALPPGTTRYQLYWRLGGPQGRSGRVRKISPPPGFDARTVQPVTSRSCYNNNNNNNSNNTDKQNKYQELTNAICAMWKQKATQMIPIVISSTGVIPKSLSQSLTTFNLHPNTYIQLQKSVILGTCSVVRNFLNYK